MLLISFTITLNILFNYSCDCVDFYIRRQNMGAKRNVSKKSHLNTLEFLVKTAAKLGVRKQ